MKNLSIKAGKIIDITEFNEMSDIFTSIDYDLHITDKEFQAIEYFAKLHNVSVFKVVGNKGIESIRRYAEKNIDHIKLSLRGQGKTNLKLEQLKNNINIIIAADLMAKNKVH